MYLSYSERPADGVTTDIYLVTSKDKGVTWSAPIKISDNGASNVFPAIGAGGLAGNVDIAWLESESKDSNDPSALWRTVMVQGGGALGSKPVFVKQQVSKGIIHNADICNAGTLCAATGGNRNLLDYIWMDIDHEGIAHIVYPADEAGPVKTVYAKQVGGLSPLEPRTAGLATQIRKP